VVKLVKFFSAIPGFSLVNNGFHSQNGSTNEKIKQVGIQRFCVVDFLAQSYSLFSSTAHS